MLGSHLDLELSLVVIVEIVGSITDGFRGQVFDAVETVIFSEHKVDIVNVRFDGMVLLLV